MVRKLVSATVAAALCASAWAPGVAAAQEYRFTGFDAPRGATATVNLRVPLGPQARTQPSYGLTVGYGHTASAGLDGRTITRGATFADIRFTRDGLSRANVASFDLANLEGDRRLNMVGGKKTLLWIGLLVALGVVVCVAEVFDICEGDEDTPNSTSQPTG